MGDILKSNNESFLYDYIKNELQRDTTLEVHPAVALIDLIDANEVELTTEENTFLKRTSRVDVIITKGYGRRKVVFAIEVDSKYHDSSTQKQRDKLKDNILRKSGINILRFRQIHFTPNKYNELFIDAVLSNIRNQEFIRALGIQAWTGNVTAMKDHPAWLITPFQKEMDELITLTENSGERLEFRQDWCQEIKGITWNRQSLISWSNNVGKQVVSSAGRCNRKEYLFGAHYAAEDFAKMGCLYKNLINKKIIVPEKRPFLHFLDDAKQYNQYYDCYSEFADEED